MTALLSGRSARALAASLFLVLAAPCAFADGLTKEAKQKVLDKLTSIVTTSAFVPGEDFTRLPKMLDEQKAAIEKAETDEQFTRAVNEVLFKFGKSHLALITPNQAKQRREGKTVGLGVTVRVIEEGLFIVRVLPGSAAAEAKLQAGEKIVGANGKPVKNVGDLAGKEGEAVTVKILGRDGKERELNIVRRAFSIVRKEELSWIDQDTAVLAVHTFDLTYDHDNVEELLGKASKAKRLIIDLRDNGGGVVWNVQHFLGLFLPASTPFGTFVKRSTVESYASQTKGDKNDLKAIAAWSSDKMRAFRNDMPRYKGKVAVLVNGATGSGAEIAAAALREELHAPVVGGKSAGAVLVALMQALPEGYTLLYPLMDYVTIKGHRLEGNGVTPDVEASDPEIETEAIKDDAVLKAAGLLAQNVPSTAPKS